MRLITVILLAFSCASFLKCVTRMLDRCKISLHAVELHPSLATDPSRFAAEHGLPDLVWQPRTSARNKARETRVTAKISLLADDALVIWVRQEGHRFFAISLEFNPTTLLYGHNGALLATPYRLSEALTELRALVAILLRRQSDADHVIPGLKTGNATYWNMLEILLHFHDPDGHLLHVFSNCSHPSIRNGPRDVKGESRLLEGSAMSVNLYRKDLELKWLTRKFDAATPLPSILRVEYKLKGKKLQSYFGTGGAKLTSFTFADLRRVHGKITSELHGVSLLPDLRNTKTTTNSRFIAAQVLKGRDSADDFISDYATISGCNRNTLSTLRRDVRTILAMSSRFPLGDLIGDSAFLNQPEIRIPNLENYTAANRRALQPDPNILAIYGRSEFGGGTFTPHVTIDELSDFPH